MAERWGDGAWMDVGALRIDLVMVLAFIMTQDRMCRSRNATRSDNRDSGGKFFTNQPGREANWRSTISCLKGLFPP